MFVRKIIVSFPNIAIATNPELGRQAGRQAGQYYNIQYQSIYKVFPFYIGIEPGRGLHLLLLLSFFLGFCPSSVPTFAMELQVHTVRRLRLPPRAPQVGKQVYFDLQLTRLNIAIYLIVIFFLSLPLCSLCSLLSGHGHGHGRGRGRILGFDWMNLGIYFLSLPKHRDENYTSYTYTSSLRPP